MIRIIYKGGNTQELMIIGHANYAENGKDIVCAGVSAITFALLGYIEPYNTKNIISDGNVYVRCETNVNTATAFNMAVIGYEQIANTYPDYVSVEYDLPQKAADSRE